MRGLEVRIGGSEGEFSAAYRFGFRGFGFGILGVSG